MTGPPHWQSSLGKPFLVTSASAIVAVALLIVGVRIASAHSAGKKQRIAITFHSLAATFVLTPLTPGPIRSDSGTYSSCCWTRRVFTRDGESMEVDDPTVTMRGKRGTFIWHERLTFVNIDNGYDVATGRWTITRGTGAYEHLEGHGLEAAVDRKNVEVAVRDEGLVDLDRRRR